MTSLSSPRAYNWAQHSHPPSREDYEDYEDYKDSEMSWCTGGEQDRPRPAAVLAAVVSGISLLAAACTGGGSSGGSHTGSIVSKLLAFSSCMREPGCRAFLIRCPAVVLPTGR